MRPNPIERLLNDLKADALSARKPWERVASSPEGAVLNQAAAAAHPAKPVTQAQIDGIHTMINIVAKTAESCDLSLAKHITTQGHQIKALEEAICPRVAARLQSLEKAQASHEEFNGLQGAENRLVFERLKQLEARLDAKPAAPAKPADPVFYINNVPYTAEEGQVARLIADGGARSVVHWQIARTIVRFVRGS